LGEANFHRVAPEVPRGHYCLDGVHQIKDLLGLGAACARYAMPMLRREFITTRREEFIPFSWRAFAARL
jgi:hypothetical protein